MSEKKTEEELELEKPGMHFYTDNLIAKEYESERFASLCAQRTHVALRKNTKLTELNCPWMLSVSGSYGVDVTVNPVEGFEPTKSEEHKIMRWLKQTLGVPKDVLFTRLFYEHSGKFEWRLYDYLHFKAPPDAPHGDHPLSISVANRNHNCKLIKRQKLMTVYESICKDDQSELEFS
jgi:ribosomal protein L36